MLVDFDNVALEPCGRCGLTGGYVGCCTWRHMTGGSTLQRILIQHPSEKGISGVGTYAANLARGLREEGYQVRVVTSVETSVRDRLRSVSWCDVVHLNSHDLVVAAAGRLLRKKVVIKYHWPFWDTAKYDGQSYGYLGRLKRELALIWRNRKAPDSRGFLSQSARLAARMLTQALSTQILACSRFTASSLELSRRVDPVPNPFVFPPSQAHRHLSVPRTFVFAGRLVEDKGVDTLIRAATLVAEKDLEFSVRIYGEGPARPSLESMCKDLGLAGTVRFEGAIPREQVNAVMASAVAVVVPPRWLDPAPYPPIEAASMGVPTIAANIGGLPETAGPEALLFTPEDVAGLADRMCELLRDDTESLARGERAYRYARSVFGVAPATAAFVRAISGNSALASER